MGDEMQSPQREDYHQICQISNEFVGGSLGVRDIADKMQESRLRWYGHIRRRSPEYVGNLALHLSLTGRRSRGTPKTRSSDGWWETLTGTSL
ncbi:hypothetical protein RR48_13474 [Papilio machaon]|uniref:Uncharacterized protein n=1 Tax=Papilio machaon TaxID=76193 RepID=A0A194R986_PAPMA|nr:hypothetical protein RR48_13474 [Papilio machaon]